MASTTQYVLTRSPIYVSGSNVGIGTLSPVYKFQVNGDISGTRLYTGSDCRSNWPGGGITGSGSSDQVTLNKVLSLQPKQFTLKNDPLQKISGLIAQDVEQIAPELVFTDEKGYEQIKYGDIQWLLIEDIKEQKRKLRN
jgi:hypothetical protein